MTRILHVACPSDCPGRNSDFVHFFKLQSFLYFNGRLIAIEERGTGYKLNQVKVTSPKTGTDSTVPAPTTADTPANLITAPDFMFAPLPVPNALPKPADPAPPMPDNTPAATHTADPPA